MIATFRDAIREKSPQWLRGYYASRLLYAIGLIIDAIADALLGGVKARFPGSDTTGALEVLARDRKLARGWTEAAVAFAARLRAFRDEQRLCGSPYPFARQLRELVGSSIGDIEIVAERGITVTIDSAGAITRSTQTWGWDSSGTWSRIFVVLHDATWAAEDTWGTGTWADGGVWGSSTLTRSEVTSLVDVVRRWTPAHAKCVHVIAVLDEVAWAAALPPTDWGEWINRPNEALFLDGSA